MGAKIGWEVSGSRRGEVVVGVENWAEGEVGVASGGIESRLVWDMVSDIGTVGVEAEVEVGSMAGAVGAVEVDIVSGAVVAVVVEAGITVGAAPVFLFPSLAIFCDIVGIVAPVKCMP